jgi:catechol 2,3-dioxygenase-like lactoylglutathione lyase family enzyme
MNQPAFMEDSIMRFEHVNLRVRDIERSLRFYRAAFPHWRIRGGGSGTRDERPERWVHFGDAHSYIAFCDGGTGQNRDLGGAQVGMAHFAFETVDLDGLVQRLSEAGFQPSSPGTDDPHRRNIYYIDNDGFEIEFVEYGSDEPKKRNRYDDPDEHLLDLLVTHRATKLRLPRIPW